MKIQLRKWPSFPPLAYEKVRKETARSLGLRTSVLDSEVDKLRDNAEHEDIFPQVSPSSEAIDPVGLLDELVSMIQRFIVCSTETVNAAALCITFTWFIKEVQVAPLAIISSPEKRCGKTLLLSLFN